MPVPSRFVLHQGPMLGALARSAWTMARGPLKGGSTKAAPGPEIRRVLPPRPASLIRAYVRHVGGDPSAYRHRLPPHFAPQWVLPLMARTLEGLPYSLGRVMNGGCRLEMRAPLPSDEPLHVTARLEGIDDNGSRAVLHQRAVTGTPSQPDALVTDLYAIVPLAKRSGKTRERPRVPHDVRELAFWNLRASAGRDFAKLTGDFNPVHWVPAYARAMGFRNVILHGFSTLARAMEGVHRGLHAGDPARIGAFDARFTRPLVLPARVGLYWAKGDGTISVGDGPGGPAYMTATFETTKGDP